MLSHPFDSIQTARKRMRKKDSQIYLEKNKERKRERKKERKEGRKEERKKGRKEARKRQTNIPLRFAILVGVTRNVNSDNTRAVDTR